jgi:hypothetical protein
MSELVYMFWTKPRLLARIFQLEEENAGLRESMQATVDSLRTENEKMREFLDAEKSVAIELEGTEE